VVDLEKRSDRKTLSVALGVESVPGKRQTANPLKILFANKSSSKLSKSGTDAVVRCGVSLLRGSLILGLLIW
jgi:hypothetical protein